MSLVALARLPYADYMSRRVVVFICGVALALLLWTEAKRWTPWIIAFAPAAAIFNPIVPVRLSREVWMVLNLAVAGVFLGHLLAGRRSRNAT